MVYSKSRHAHDISIYLQQLFGAAMYSIIVRSKIIVQHSHFGLWDYVPPPLPKHAICIFSVEYTYPHTDKIFWLGKGGTYLYRTFPVFYMFDSKTKMLESKFRSSSILTEKMNRSLINVDVWLHVSQKIFDFFRELNFEVVAWAYTEPI